MFNNFKKITVTCEASSLNASKALFLNSLLLVAVQMTKNLNEKKLMAFISKIDLL